MAALLLQILRVLLAALTLLSPMSAPSGFPRGYIKMVEETGAVIIESDPAGLTKSEAKVVLTSGYVGTLCPSTTKEIILSGVGRYELPSRASCSDTAELVLEKFVCAPIWLNTEIVSLTEHVTTTVLVCFDRP